MLFNVRIFGCADCSSPSDSSYDPTVSWEGEAHDANEVFASILKLEQVEH
jgi:hypothetical protein